MLLSPEDLTRLQALRRCYDRLRAGGRGHEEAKDYLARGWVGYGGTLYPGDLERATSDAFEGLDAGGASCAASPLKKGDRSVPRWLADLIIDSLVLESVGRGTPMSREEVVS